MYRETGKLAVGFDKFNRTAIEREQEIEPPEAWSKAAYPDVLRETRSGDAVVFVFLKAFYDFDDEGRIALRFLNVLRYAL